MFKASLKVECRVTWRRMPVKTVDMKGILGLISAHTGSNTSCSFLS